MKKSYKKPEMYAERFQVSEHITSCSTVCTIGADCGVLVDNGLVLFTSTVCGSDAASMWGFAGFTDPSTQTFANVGSLGLDCYNSFHNPSSFFTS